MNVAEKEKLVSVYLYDIADYAKKTLQMTKRGFNTRERDIKVWLMTRYLDFINKYNNSYS